MSEYNLLTINGITKICDDNYYLDSNNNLTEFQWYDFQIHYALENQQLSKLESKLNLINKYTGYKLTRSQIYRNILEKTGKAEIILSKKSDINDHKKFGIFKPKNSENELSFDCLGGKSNPSYSFNYQTNKVNIPDEYLYGIKISHDFYTNNYNKIKSLENKLPINPRITKELKQMQANSNKLLNLGKFDWEQNSCYIDSVLLPIIYYVILNPNTFLSQKLKNYRYDSKTILNSKNCFSKSKHLLEENVRIQNMNNVIDLFNNLSEKIISGEILHARSVFINPMVKLCSTKILTNDYTSNSIGDVKDFLRMILNGIYNLEISSAHIVKTLKIIEKNSDEYEDDILSKVYVLSEDLDTYYQQSLINGNNLDIVNHKPELIICDISSQIIMELYKNNLPVGYTGTYKNFIDKKKENSILNIKEKYFFDRYSNQWILYKFRKHILSSRINFIFPIEYFIKIRYTTDLEEENIESYIYNQDYYEYIDTITNEKYYYHINDKENIKKYKKSNQILEEHGSKVSYSIVENVILDINDEIFFEINRQHSQGIFDSLIRIIPTEQIILKESTKIYYFNFAILYIPDTKHYVSILKLEEEYFLYDDLYNPILKNSYLEKIGNYQKLINYKFIKKEGTPPIDSFIEKYSVLLHYSAFGQIGGNNSDKLIEKINNFRYYLNLLSKQNYNITNLSN